MADIYVDWCPKCGGRGEVQRENGELLIRCNNCRRSVTICHEDELEVVNNSRQILIPNEKAVAAFNEWNAKEVANG